jgi:peptidoglycan hydrolase FlgJ
MSGADPLPPAAMPLPASPMPAAAEAAHRAARVPDARLHKVAKQFEAVFMSEMLRLARPPDKAAPGFGAGQEGGTWQVFMDQALGEAATAKGGTGLAKQIEDALRRAQGGGQGGGQGGRGGR